MNKNMSEFMELLEHYFTVYLPSSVGVSPNTITSYKYAFKLLLRFSVSYTHLTLPTT